MASGEQPKIKLYWLEQSRAQNVLWLLEELKLDYELELFRRNKQTRLAGPDLQKVHPLGKSPVVEITPPGPDAEPIKLAESGFIFQYMVEHFPEGQRLVPARWKPGRENQIGGETDSWMRYQYLLNYVEGSLFPILFVSLVVGSLKSTNIPFFVRPITTMVANRIFAALIFPNAQRHLAMLEQFVETAPEGGKYICGPELTAADILLSFALVAAEERLDGFGAWEGGSAKAAHPRLFEYIARLKEEPGYKKSLDKIRELDDSFSPVFGQKAATQAEE